MKMQIGRWGNSLAVRLPKELVDRYNLREGGEIDTAAIEAALGADREQRVQSEREAAMERIKATRLKLPPDWKFDREEANAR